MRLKRRTRLALIVPLVALVFSTLPWQPATANDRIRPVARPLLQDNVVYADGLGHNSRDPLFRTPIGAQPAGATITLRFRTFHDDVQKVTLRTLHTAIGTETLQPMERVAQDVDCYTPDLPFVCDWWQATINVGSVGVLRYRFVAEDGTKTLFYEDDSDVLDGGWGKTAEQSADRNWTIGVFDPGAALPIQWMREAIVYQIVPDRFRNGNAANDPAPQPDNAQLSTAPRYAYPNGEAATGAAPAHDQIVRQPWGALPEGYCRQYADVDAAECPQRFPQPGGDGMEQPRGRDYYGGDLLGVTQKLDYLKSLGVTVLLFNPIFAAASNHRYDTRDYRVVDPYLGDLGDWETLVRESQARGMRIILDGVFDHVSSDSPLFDRYGRWLLQPPASTPHPQVGTRLPEKVYVPLLTGNGAPPALGACLSADSPYRSWFRLREPTAPEPAVCAPATADAPSFYDGLAGVDRFPLLGDDAAVREYIYGADNSVARSWLQAGAAGWRLNDMPNRDITFWREFRQRVKQANPDAVIVGDLWNKTDTQPFMDGTTADTALNYRLRDAVIGLLAPGAFDAKSFPGSGQPITPSAFANRLQSIREDYGDAAFYSMMNLLGSHDTERLVWALTPGAANAAERDANAANIAQGKQRQRLAALIQMTLPGAPTIYYGDEVALSGGDDPDNRRTYPWGDVQGDPRQPDNDMLAYYTGLTALRRANAALGNGDLQFLFADDTNGTLAYARKVGDAAAIVVLNTAQEVRKITVPVGGYLPDSTVLRGAAGCLPADATVTVEKGVFTLELPPLCGAVVTAVEADLTPTAAPTGLTAAATDLTMELAWAPVEGAARYALYRSPVAGGGYVEIAVLDADTTTYLDADEELIGGQRYFYIAKALDNKGNASTASNEANAMPTHPIASANIARPATLRYAVSAKATTEPVLGHIRIENVTSEPGPTRNLIAQLGYGPQGSDPRAWTTWTAMEFSADVRNNDEWKGMLQPDAPGTYSYLVRYSTSGGERWIYADVDGISDGGAKQQTDQPGVLEVVPNDDQTPPAAPTNLQAATNDVASIRLSWEVVPDPVLFRYQVYRKVTGGEYVRVGVVDANTTTFTDVGLQPGTPTFYMVRAVDEAGNVGSPSTEASAVP